MGFPSILFVGQADHAGLCAGVIDGINRVQPGTALSLVPAKGSRRAGSHGRVFEKANRITGNAALKAGAVRWVICSDGFYKPFRAWLLAHKLDTPALRAERNIRLGVVHAGSHYRGNPVECNAADDDLGMSIRFISPDSTRFCQKDPRVWPLRNSYYGIKPPAEALIKATRKPVVCHAPSQGPKKGSDAIMRVLGQMAHASNSMTLDHFTGVGHRECLTRKAKSAIYVDQMVSHVGGYGQSSIEALAMGCVVFCDIRHVRLLGKFPMPPIQHSARWQVLDEGVKRLVRNPDMLRDLRLESLRWAVANAAPAVVGRYWLDALAERAAS